MSTQHGFMLQFPGFYFSLHRLGQIRQFLWGLFISWFFFVPCSCRETGRNKRLRTRTIKYSLQFQVYFPNAKSAEFQYVTVPNLLLSIKPFGKILYMLRWGISAINGKIKWEKNPLLLSRKDIYLMYSVWAQYYCIIEGSACLIIL